MATIRFAAGSAGVSEKGRNEIARIARMFAGKDRVEILVCGHSDPTPIERSQERYLSNMHLSAARALAVYHEFVARPGVHAARVAVVAWGQHRPLAGGPNELRRVEIRVRPAARSSPARLTRPARAVAPTPRPTVRKRPAGREAVPRPPARPKPLRRGEGPEPKPPAARPQVPAPAAGPGRGAPPPGDEPEPWR